MTQARVGGRAGVAGQGWQDRGGRTGVAGQGGQDRSGREGVGCQGWPPY